MPDLRGSAGPKRLVVRHPERIDRVLAHNLRVETIPVAGHFLPEEAPQAVLDLAHRRLDRQSP